MTNNDSKQSILSYHETINEYSQETISSCFTSLNSEHQLAIIMSATEALTQCLLSTFDLEDYIELSGQLIDTPNPNHEHIIL